ncbi:hypothetical protein [Methanobrevibacter sp.]|uniref:hypothetical protein n=1 Tax=Methanobrevibacter sp. TaxID=66852 RepID=UPI0025FE18A1|nr:hypothetical protein [Methanobrevibacter sp.]MBQ2831954.1 hypothetical protein [Methanobrevibacter sp.]
MLRNRLRPAASKIKGIMRNWQLQFDNKMESPVIPYQEPGNMMPLKLVNIMLKLFISDNFNIIV